MARFAMDPIRHRRRALRLDAYDYSQAGAYFVTVCTHDRACIFGDVSADAVQLNDDGIIAQQTWNDLPAHYPHATLDAFVVMPNHVHGIVVLTDEPIGLLGAGLKPAPTMNHPVMGVGAGSKPAPKRHAVSEIVRAFKTFSARRINDRRGSRGATVWQRNYYEHVVRNEAEMNRIRQYIADNPMRWGEDQENPKTWSDRIG